MVTEAYQPANKGTNEKKQGGYQADLAEHYLMLSSRHDDGVLMELMY
jgi:hypothetical protein